MTGQMVALGDLFQIGSSKRVLKSQWKTEGVPFYRGREITRLAADGYVDNELFISEEHFAELAAQSGVPKPGDIVITAIGTIGNAHIVLESDRFYFKDASVLWMKRTSDVSSEFINLWLKSPLFFDQLDKGNGATVDTLTIQKLQSVRLSVPPLPEQERIVALLDEAFAAIATARAHAEQNLQNARALFESQLQVAFSQRCEGWIVTTLDNISTNLDSKRIPITKSDRKAGGYPYYGASGIVDYVADYIFDGDSLLISEDGANLLARSTPIAFSVSGKYWVNNHAHILKFEHMVTQRFVEFYFASIRLDEYITGAAQPKLNQKALNSIPVPIPTSLEAQGVIVEQIESMQEETQRLETLYLRKLDALDELKQSLLHKAFSGNL